jgi:hypothetical protein
VQSQLAFERTTACSPSWARCSWPDYAEWHRDKPRSMACKCASVTATPRTVRHSSGVGINLQDERGRSASLPARRARQDRRASSHGSDRRATAVRLRVGGRQGCGLTTPLTPLQGAERLLGYWASSALHRTVPVAAPREVQPHRAHGPLGYQASGPCRAPSTASRRSRLQAIESHLRFVKLAARKTWSGDHGTTVSGFLAASARRA